MSHIIYKCRTLFINVIRYLYMSHVIYILIKDIRNFERIQRRATKFILQDYSHDYKTRLLSLNLLPLMHWYELQDMMFLVKCFKNPMDNLIIHDYVEFVTSTTRASSNGKLRHKFCRLSTPRHFYFNRIVRLWNLFPRIDLSLSLPSIKHLLLNHLWSNFCSNFDANNVCSFHLLCPCAKCQL